VQVFSRTATRDAEIGNTRIAKNERVMIYFGAANRDPRRWEDPDRFDFTREASRHLAFGLGIHGCVGKPVARLEGEAVLGALARRVGRIELDGEPRRHLNSTVRGFESLPVTSHAPCSSQPWRVEGVAGAARTIPQPEPYRPREKQKRRCAHMGRSEVRVRSSALFFALDNPQVVPLI
jgi:hypothetical protein